MGASVRTTLPDGTYFDWSITRIKPDEWRPHGIRYRLAWVKGDECLVLFDNHHGKGDHCHINGKEREYLFSSAEKLWADFRTEVRKQGGEI